MKQSEDAPAGDPSRETYTHGYSPQVEALMAGRTASRAAPFLVPHLRRGQSLLDCGCGPGSTTVDLAVALAPGQVVGVDIEPSQIAVARVRAAAQHVPNVRFE